MLKMILGMAIGIVLMANWEDQTIAIIDYLKQKSVEMLSTQDINQVSKDMMQSLAELPEIMPQEASEQIEDESVETFANLMVPQRQPESEEKVIKVAETNPVKSQAPSWAELQGRWIKNKS